METPQDFWESLQKKYVDRNQALQKRETELRYKLEALQAVVGDVPKTVEKSPPIMKYSGFSQSPAAPKISETMTQSTVPTIMSVQGSDAKSCACPEHEKPCFLKNCLALFPPWKNKIATKVEEKPPETKNLPIKNENCMCDPCQADLQASPPQPQQKDDSICHCSICSKLTNAKSLCCCNFELLTEGEILHPTKSARGKDESLTPTHPISPSKLSLKSADLHYMKNIHELATQQKAYQNTINELEQKAKIFEEIMNEYKNLDFTPKKAPEDTTTTSPLTEKMNAELKIENFLLKNELKEMRLEVRQYIERMEGPMLFKIESEKYKNAQLELKLEQAAEDLAKTQELYDKEINTLKMQLCTAQSNLYNVTETNKKLNEDLEITKSRCCQLNDDLVRQKISEAETLKMMRECLMEKEKPVQEECNLHQIARDLSKVLKECEPCGECINLPEDLTTAARLLKSLTDMIDQQIPKDSTKKGSENVTVAKEDSNCTCTEATDECIQEQKSVEQSEKLGSLDYKPSEKSAKSEAKASYLEEKISEAAKSEGSAKQSEEVQKTDDEKEILPTKESEKSAKQSIATVPSEAVKSEEVKSEKIEEVKSEKPEEEKSEKLGSANFKERAPEISSKNSSVATFEDGTQIRKPSCKCPSPAIKEEEGITPPCKCFHSLGTAAQPITQKESTISEETRKKWCKCAEARKTVAEKDTTTKPCKCATKEIKEFVPAAYEGPTAAKKPCHCGKTPSQVEKTPEKTDLSVAKPPVDLLWPKDSEKLMLSHQVTASRSQELLKSQAELKAFNIKENFPFKVDTQVDIINKKPDGVHVTTTITDSGMLEVVTEGPEGFIETTLIYTKSGNVEVMTEILEYQAKGKQTCNRGTLKATSTCAKTIESAPGGIKALPSAEVADILPESQSKAETESKAITLPESQSMVKPTCKCKPCVALEGVQKAASEVGERSVKESERSVKSTKESKVTLPEDCKCIVCPETELEKDLNVEVKKSAVSEKSSKTPLPSDCKCISCPQDAGKESSLKVPQEKESEASRPSQGGGCKCRKCV